MRVAKSRLWAFYLSRRGVIDICNLEFRLKSLNLFYRSLDAWNYVHFKQNGRTSCYSMEFSLSIIPFCSSKISLHCFKAFRTKLILFASVFYLVIV